MNRVYEDRLGTLESKEITSLGSHLLRYSFCSKLQSSFIVLVFIILINHGETEKRSYKSFLVFCAFSIFCFFGERGIVDGSVL